MEALLGSYYLEQGTCHLSVNHSGNISKKQIEDICKEIIKRKIQNLTLEFDDGNLIFFTNLQDRIRFIEGPKPEFIDLQQKAKDDVDGEIVMQQITEEDPNTLSSLEPDPKSSSLGQEVIIQHSFFSAIAQFKKVFADAEIYFKPFEDPGGDFYWMKKYENHSLVVVGDCTGHGVQGAMISMSVMTMLKQFFRTFPESIENSIYGIL